MRTINQAGIDLIKSFEGLMLTAYRCSAKKLTIGYGRAHDVYEGQVITKEQAEAWLIEDLQEAGKAVSGLVKVRLTDNEFAALTSFVFNVGIGHFRNSTLLKMLNDGLYDQVPQQLARWNKVNGEVMGGLARRRKAEARLWDTQ